MADTLTDEQKERLKKFDPHKPLVINAAEIAGLENVLGRFVFKRPTVSDRLQISILNNKLKQNQELDVFHENLSYVIASLKTVCTEKPIDFEFEEAYELEPLFAIYERFSEWLNFFRLAIPTTKNTVS